MEYAVEIYYPRRLDIFHASKIFTGLAGLAGRRRLRYTIRGVNPWGLDDITVGMEVTHAQCRRKLAIDLRDRSDCVCLPALDACDLYWKRSFRARDTESLGPNRAPKVRPWGLNFPCRGNGSSIPVLARQLLNVLRCGGTSMRGDREPLRQTIAGIRDYVAAPSATKFSQAPTVRLAPIIFFQTRVWDPIDVHPDDPEAVNTLRADVVRALRREFGPRFHGGLVPTETARRRYPDLLTNLPTRRSQYLALCKGALIGIYTRGLHFSNAFKLSEYLAASHTIVSDHLVHELPVPLRPWTHFLPFANADECVQRCAQLLADPDLVQAMRAANHQYYSEEVEPAAHLLKCLERSFAEPANAGVRRDQ